MRNLSKKKQFAFKSIYTLLPKEKSNYLIIYKQLHSISQNIYIIKKVSNISVYLNNHKKNKILLFKYYILKNVDSFDFSSIKEYKKNIHEYQIDDIKTLYSLIDQSCDGESFEPVLNTRFNPCM